MDRSRSDALPLTLVGGTALLAMAIALSIETPLGARWAGPALWIIAALLLLSVGLLRRQQRRHDTTQRKFAAGFSHQVRTPLAHIRAFNEMLLLGRERSESERHQWLEVVGREAERLGAVVENLLLVTHQRNAQQFPGRRAVDLGPMIEDVAASYAAVAAARSTNIALQSPGGVMVMVDARAVQQAVANLLDNAIRHGPEGQTISVTLETRGNAALISVTDQGARIALRDRKRIWKPFVRLGETAASEEGCGLGLTVVQQVAAAHGGSAYMEDAPGGTKRFCLALPGLNGSQQGLTTDSGDAVRSGA